MMLIIQIIQLFFWPFMLMVGGSLCGVLLGSLLIFISNKKTFKKNLTILYLGCGMLSSLVVVLLTATACYHEPGWIEALVLGGFALVMLAAVAAYRLTNFCLKSIAESGMHGTSLLKSRPPLWFLGLVVIAVYPFVSEEIDRVLHKRLMERLDSGDTTESFGGQEIMQLAEPEKVQSVTATDERVGVTLVNGQKKCFQFRENQLWEDCPGQIFPVNNYSSVRHQVVENPPELAPPANLRIVESFIRRADAFAVAEEKRRVGIYRLIHYEYKNGGMRLGSNNVDITLRNADGSYGGLWQKSARVSAGVNAACLKVDLGRNFLVVSTCRGVYVVPWSEKEN